MLLEAEKVAKTRKKEVVGKKGRKVKKKPE
jgi:hypothetical protein